MQIVVLLLLVAGLALLVLGLITASTPLVLASVAASLLAGYAISRYRRQPLTAPAAGAASDLPAEVHAPVAAGSSAVAARSAAAPTRSSAVTVAELARAVAAERAGEPTTVLSRHAEPAGPVAAAGVVTPGQPIVRTEPAHAAPAQAAPAALADHSVGGSAAVAEPALSQDLDGAADVDEADPPIADTDPPLRSRGAEPVWVVDGRPRYHLSSCGFLLDRAAEPVPLRQAFEDGFTPCGLCDPDTALAAR